MFIDILIIYSLAILLPGLIIGAYFILKKLNKISDKVLNISLKVLSIITFVSVFTCIFFIQGVMVPSNDNQTFGRLLEGSGNIFLTGAPYGNAKFLNFLAWLANALFLPCAFIVPLMVFFPSKTTKLLNKFVLFPSILLISLTAFNFVNAMHGDLTLSFETIILSLEIGLVLATSALFFIQDGKTIKFDNWKEIIYTIMFYLTVFVWSMPVNTFATLFDPYAPFLGTSGFNLRVYDLSLIHRIFLFILVFMPTFMYFVNRDKNLNTKKVLVLASSLGALAIFLTSFGYSGLFIFNESGQFTGINVNNLPIHLCHTALFVVPICVAFNLKKLFYFTYFINVFGAVIAMVFPNVGEDLNYLSPDVILFWYNHIAAFSMPLLCVALGIFEKPKMKQMTYSLIYFAVYMLVIIFLNAWLSNYVKGFNPDKLGTGTDYLFVNGTFILDKLSDEAYHMLDVKLQWQWGDCIFVIYPLYQPLFFVGYSAIAFAMWFVYSLFFQVADSHKDLHNQLVIMRLQKIKFKEMLKMAKLENETIDHQTAKLKYIHFSKRYGASKKLSANDVNLEVNAGEIFGFLGPNGAGKSTCIKTTIGIQPVTEGTIEVCGYNVSTQPVEAKKVIGYVPDHYALYEKLTGREYINYIADLYGVSKEDRDARISKYVDIFELTQAFDNRMQTYSHGMKQKMTIMAALVHNPKIWILDEPLTGLDPQSIYQVKEVMKIHAKEGNIVFFSSHIINVVEKLCTRIAIIKKGHIVFEDSMENIIKNHPEGLEEFYMRTIRDNGDLDE